MIHLAEYDADWPRQFEQEAAALARALGESALRIEHVGSTAVPGLAAKPVIDLQVSVASLARMQQFCDRLQPLGYVHVPLGAFDRVYPYFEKPQRWPHSHHVHLCVAGSAQERDHLLFRDTLRKDPAIAREYVTLKRELAALHGAETLAERERYSLAKSDFVQRVLAQAREGRNPP